MQTETQKIANFAVKFLLEKFREGLKIHHLLQHTSEYIMLVHQMATYELIYAGQFPCLNQKLVEQEDALPKNIEPDQIANFSIEEISLTQQQHHQLENQISNFQKKIKKIKNEVSLVLPDFQKGAFALSEPITTPEECKLEQEIGEIKKKLSFIRKLRKENQDEQRKRCQEFNNRKHLELPTGKQYAYDFNGQFLFKKRTNFKKGQTFISKESTMIQSGKSVDVNELAKQKEKQHDSTSQRDILVSRDQGGSREGKRVLFGNSGKRQVSNLPFIKLGENIKLTQNHRIASGPDTNRYTLKSYHSRGESTFKSFAELQKQRTQRLYSLKRSSKFSEMTEEDVEDVTTTTRVQIRKQSKRMQKYLKKLCEDRSKDFVIEINKSSNFDRLNSPHDYSIHRYYKHNFDDDKRSICDTSLASLRFNHSHFQDVKN